MSSVSRTAPGATLAALLLTLAPAALLSAGDSRAGSPPVLRVCADPNNMPFSSRSGAGFENALAELVARDLGLAVEYTWWPQRRGFIRHTLGAKRCDVVMGVPRGYELAATTRPYYRSTYVFVTRPDGPAAIRSFDDPRLARLRIGIHAIGDDGAGVPPAQALAERGLVENIRGFSIYGSYAEPDPPRGLIDAVVRAEVDVAIAWGPLAGYFAKAAEPPLRVQPVAAEEAMRPRMRFDICMGVRRDDAALRRALDGVIARRQSEIRSLLREFGVPLVDGRGR